MSLSKENRSVCINPTDQGEIENGPESVHMVMNLEELRDMIVAQVILSENSYEYRDKAIRSLRLVSKSWQLSVSRVLYKNGLALIKIDMNEKQIDELAEILDNFVKRFSSVFSANDRNAPTYTLQLHPFFNGEDRFSILQQCLVQCGKGLLGLDVPVQLDNQFPDTLPKFALPNLKNLCVYTDNWGNYGLQKYEIIGIKVGNVLKHLLEGSSSLKSLNLKSHIGLKTLGFDNFLLPSTLAELWITAYMIDDLEMFSRNPLPKLSALRLKVESAQISGGLFFNTLQNWHKTLKTLDFSIDNIYEEIQLGMVFPVMENLDTFTFHVGYCRSMRSSRSLALCFPNLKTLKLQLAESNYQTWCVNSVFGSVEILKIHRRNEFSMPMPMNLQTIQLTCMAFPNVTKLHIDISESDTSVPQYIFKEMQQLRSLKFRVNYTEIPEGSKYWDALFIGTTVETAKELQDSLDNPESVQNTENPNTPSIRCLTHLTSLSLCAYSIDGHFIRFFGHLLSGVSFIYAFSKMPNLETLQLGGEFVISNKMLEWLKPKMGPNFTIIQARYNFNRVISADELLNPYIYDV